MLYKNLSGYLKEKYGGRMKKICIDGGFTCPNRDGTLGRGGCIYCSERGSGEHIDASVSIKEQVERALKSAAENDKYIAYFQNFTNTYAPIAVLKARYDAALIDSRIRILAIGTRPDCIDGDIADLIASYKDRVDVWVELGLQTASDKTAEIINRGYKTQKYIEACSILHSRGIPTVTHIMIGLPGEGDGELEETLDTLDRSGTWGVKIHSVYVAKGTRLEKMYLEGSYIPISREDYVRRAAYAISRLPEKVIHRITGDCPRELLAAPAWNTDKNGVIKEINERLSAILSE